MSDRDLVWLHQKLCKEAIIPGQLEQQTETIVDRFGMQRYWYNASLRVTLLTYNDHELLKLALRHGSEDDLKWLQRWAGYTEDNVKWFRKKVEADVECEMWNELRASARNGILHVKAPWTNWTTGAEGRIRGDPDRVVALFRRHDDKLMRIALTGFHQHDKRCIENFACYTACEVAKLFRDADLARLQGGVREDVADPPSDDKEQPDNDVADAAQDGKKEPIKDVANAAEDGKEQPDKDVADPASDDKEEPDKNNADAPVKKMQCVPEGLKTTRETESIQALIITAFEKAVQQGDVHTFEWVWKVCKLPASTLERIVDEELFKSWWRRNETMFQWLVLHADVSFSHFAERLQNQVFLQYVRRDCDKRSYIASVARVFGVEPKRVIRAMRPYAHEYSSKDDIVLVFQCNFIGVLANEPVLLSLGKHYHALCNWMPSRHQIERYSIAFTKHAKRLDLDHVVGYGYFLRIPGTSERWNLTAEELRAALLRHAPTGPHKDIEWGVELYHYKE